MIGQHISLSWEIVPTLVSLIQRMGILSRLRNGIRKSFLKVGPLAMVKKEQAFRKLSFPSTQVRPGLKLKDSRKKILKMVGKSLVGPCGLMNWTLNHTQLENLNSKSWSGLLTAKVQSNKENLKNNSMSEAFNAILRTL